VEIDLGSPRVMQGVVAGVVLFGFVFEFRALVPLAALGLIATFVCAVLTNRFGMRLLPDVGTQRLEIR